MTIDDSLLCLTSLFMLQRLYGLLWQRKSFMNHI